MWKIIDIEYRIEDGVAINVTAEFRLINGNTISRKIITVDLPEPTSNLIPFEELTEEQVIEWVKFIYPTLQIEIEVEDKLNKLITERDNKLINNKLPWE